MSKAVEPARLSSVDFVLKFEWAGQLAARSLSKAVEQVRLPSVDFVLKFELAGQLAARSSKSVEPARLMSADWSPELELAPAMSVELGLTATELDLKAIVQAARIAVAIELELGLST